MMFMPMFSPTRAQTAITGPYMRAGGYVDGEYEVYGYVSDPNEPEYNFGEIGDQPVAGETMTALLFQPGTLPVNLIGFTGNAMSSLTGKSIYIDDVEYPFSTANYFDYSIGNDETYIQWDTETFSFVEDGIYNIRIE